MNTLNWGVVCCWGICIVFPSLAADGPAAARELRLPDPPDRYAQEEWPAHFLTPAAKAFDNLPDDNPVTDAGALLGRVLFYDTRLSLQGQISCGSCHEQRHAFADPRRFSRGHAGEFTDRNSMSLVNLRFSKAGKFWDERVATLEEQVLIPIQSRVEMGQSLSNLVSLLEQDARYDLLFDAAFGDQTVTSERIARALAQFLRAMVSYRSRYDAGLAAVATENDTFPNFSDEENRGKQLFLEKCAICHRDGRGRQSAFFTSFRSLNNGLDPTADVPDAGAGDITLVPSDIGLFRPSDLRNFEFTAPYMHDGRFRTLEEVVEHYSTGVHRHPNVSGFVFRMQFTQEQKSALVAFLKTLSDDAFIKDSRFADPWHPSTPVATANENTTEIPASVALVTQPPLTDAERSQRLADHSGLPVGEALLFLLSLDRNQDQRLDRQESFPLAELLWHNGPPARFDRRLFTARDLRVNRSGSQPPAMMVYDTDQNGRLVPDEFPASRRSIVEVADLDQDGALTADEAGRFESVERFLAAQTNDRDRTRLVRLVEMLKLGDQQAQEFQQALKTAQQSLQTEKQSLDAALTSQLTTALGPERFARFQDLMLERQDAQELNRRAGDITVQTVQDQIFEFDENRDDALDSAELAELATLAAILDETPGGFGTVRLPLPSIRQFLQRILARDADQDGVVTPLEIPERYAFLIERGDVNHDRRLSPTELQDYLRRTSFDRFLVEGIYQSGGFLNAFTRSSRLLKELDLSEEEQQPLRELLDEHQARIQSSIEQTVIATYRKLRTAAATSADRGVRSAAP